MAEETTTTETTTTPMPNNAIIRTKTTTPVQSRWDDLYERFTSRKFLAYVAAILMEGAAYFQHRIDGDAAIAAILVTTASYLLAESFVDSARARARAGRE